MNSRSAGKKFNSPSADANRHSICLKNNIANPAADPPSPPEISIQSAHSFPHNDAQSEIIPRPTSASTPNSSRNSRANPSAGVSPASNFPPGNSHINSNVSPRLRWQTKIFPPDSIIPATTMIISDDFSAFLCVLCVSAAIRFKVFVSSAFLCGLCVKSSSRPAEHCRSISATPALPKSKAAQAYSKSHPAPRTRGRFRTAGTSRQAGTAQSRRNLRPIPSSSPSQNNNVRPRARHLLIRNPRPSLQHHLPPAISTSSATQGGELIRG